MNGRKPLVGFLQTKLHPFAKLLGGDIIVGAWSWSGISGEKTDSAFGGSDYWVLKLNSTGSIIWQRTIGGSQNETLTCVSVSEDGGSLVGGYSASGISGEKNEFNRGASDYWVVKLDDAGTIEWQKTVGSNGPDVLKSVFETIGGDVMLAGNSPQGISRDKTDPGLGHSDFWLVKLDLSHACLRCIPATNHGSGVSSTNLWSDEANWSLNHIPRLCEYVILDDGNQICIDDGFYGKCQTLDVKLGASLTIDLGGQMTVSKYP